MRWKASSCAASVRSSRSGTTMAKLDLHRQGGQRDLEGAAEEGKAPARRRHPRGRPNRSRGGRLDWVGTGWLVAENILVTNRHVARSSRRERAKVHVPEWAYGGRSRRRRFPSGDRQPGTLVFKLIKPLYIEESRGRTSRFSRSRCQRWQCKLAKPIELRRADRRDRECRHDRLPGLRQPHPRAGADGAHLWQDLQQEAARARRGDARRADAPPHNCTTLGGNPAPSSSTSTTARRSACISAAASSDQLRGARRRGEEDSSPRFAPAARAPEARRASAASASTGRPAWRTSRPGAARQREPDDSADRDRLARRRSGARPRRTGYVPLPRRAAATRSDRRGGSRGGLSRSRGLRSRLPRQKFVVDLPTSSATPTTCSTSSSTARPRPSFATSTTRS